jgi:hypothetical protein
MEQKQKTLKQEAEGYVPTAKTKNISDLQKVSTDLLLEDDSFEFEKDGKSKKVNQKVITVDGEKYRVPVSVIASLQAILEDNPELKFFKVKKTGEGKDGTRYTVIPLS